MCLRPIHYIRKVTVSVPKFLKYNIIKIVVELKLE